MARWLENNVINSFDNVKKDVDSLKEELYLLKKAHTELMEHVHNLSVPKVVEKTVVKEKVVNRKSKPKIVGTKEGSKFHIDHCPFALNIKPEHKVVFKSKQDAISKRYKPCRCAK